MKTYFLTDAENSDEIIVFVRKNFLMNVQNSKQNYSFHFKEKLSCGCTKMATKIVAFVKKIFLKNA